MGRSGVPVALPSLTGARFVAVLLVFAFHGTLLSVFTDDRVDDAYAFVAGNAACMGVSFFFVLSGFVLAWSARPDDTARSFWRCRAAKVVPSHVVAWALALAGALAAGITVPLPIALANLTLVQAWWSDQNAALRAVNPVAWSLSVEVAFYASFPLWWRLLRRVPEARLWAAWALVVAAALLVPAVAWWAMPSGPGTIFSETTSWPTTWLVYFFPPVRMLEFVGGVFMARIVASGGAPRPGRAPAAAAVLATYAASLWLPDVLTFAALYLAPLSLLVAALATGDARGRRGVLASRPAVWLGTVSYAFFLLHLSVLFGLAPVFVRPGAGTPSLGVSGGIAFLVLSLLVGLGAAWLLHRYVERPALVRWSSSRRRPAATERPRREATVLE